MRAGIGLLSILIVIAIILLVSFSGPKGGYVTTVVKQGQDAQSQASQLAGRDENGMTAQASIILEADESGGKIKGLIVKAIVPNGPMATAYSLLPGDEIVEVAGQKVRDWNDAEMAKALVYESYGRNQPLVIVRNGQEIKVSPDTALTTAHPDIFNKPGGTVIPTH